MLGLQKTSVSTRCKEPKTQLEIHLRSFKLLVHVLKFDHVNWRNKGPIGPKHGPYAPSLKIELMIVVILIEIPPNCEVSMYN